MVCAVNGHEVAGWHQRAGKAQVRADAITGSITLGRRRRHDMRRPRVHERSGRSPGLHAVGHRRESARGHDGALAGGDNEGQVMAALEC